VPLAGGLFRPLSEPQEAWHFVMASPPQDAETKTLDVTFTADGRLNAIVFWFELDLGSGIRLSTGPEAVLAGANRPGRPLCWQAGPAVLGQRPNITCLQMMQCRAPIF
jgi:hypothetical protein